MGGARKQRKKVFQFQKLMLHLRKQQTCFNYDQTIIITDI